MDRILILDLGSQYNQLIARRIREMHVYCELHPYDTGVEFIKEFNPSGIILPEGQGTESGECVPDVDRKIFELGIPILEIRYATQSKAVKFGGKIFSNFLFEECKVEADWKMEDYIENSLLKLREKIGDKKVVLGLSGGVDSSVVAALLARAIGKNLTAIFVDHGLLRKNEREEVENNFKDMVNLIVVDAEDEFLGKLAGVEDPEKKRKIIGNTFVDIFEREAAKIEDADFLAQGTIYPDVIESSSGSKGAAKTIKSHHNVGGLPENMKLKLVEPLRDLFKDEVRDLGLKLGLPEKLIKRHPFPGPGLAVRILGEVTFARCKILKDADHIFIEEIRNAGIYDDISQAFVVLLPVKTVGVTGDCRTYESVVSLRAVKTDDFMTADWYDFETAFLKKVSSRIINEVKRVNRVVYDISSKPPATIEWE